MAGYGDSPFRRLVRRYGSPWVTTELVSAEGLMRGSYLTLELLKRLPGEEPVGIQLFTSDPVIMAEAVSKAKEMGFLFIDINAGCPVPVVVKSGGGSALLKNLTKLETLLRAAVSVSDRVTLKYRLGWDAESIVACEVAQLAESCGIRLLALHCRTRKQAYSGEADWSWLVRVREVTTLPILGNGDVRSGEDAVRMIRETGCDGVMIGRGALGKPWVFNEVNRALARMVGLEVPVPQLIDPWAVLAEHVTSMAEWYGDSRGLLEMRKHVVCYLKGVPGAARLRERAMSLATHADLMDWLASVARDLSAPGGPVTLSRPEEGLECRM